MYRKIIVICNTNKLPLRTKKFIELFENDEYFVELINWQRSNNTRNNFIKLSYSNIRSNYLLSFCTRLIFTLYNKKYDIIYFNDIRFIPALYLIKLLKRKKIIFDYKEDFASTTIYKIFQKIKVKSEFIKYIIDRYQYFESFLVKYVDLLIKIPLRENNILNNNVITVMNLPSLSDINYISNRKKFIKKYEDKNILIYAGTVFNYEDRGLSTIIEVVNILQKTFCNIKLLVVADDFEKYNQEIICGLNINNQITEIIPYMEYKELLGMLSLCKIGFAIYNPNDINYYRMLDGCSRKIFTYMLCGLPVIASRTTFTKFITSKECGLIVDFDNVDEIVQKCSILLKNNSLWKKLSQNSFKAILEEYNLENEKSKVLNSIQQLFNNSVPTN